jgi:hypothetical protein
VHNANTAAEVVWRVASDLRRRLRFFHDGRLRINGLIALFLSFLTAFPFFFSLAFFLHFASTFLEGILVFCQGILAGLSAVA